MGQMSKKYNQYTGLYNYESLFLNSTQTAKKAAELYLSDKTDEEKIRNIKQFTNYKTVDLIETIFIGEKLNEISDKLN